jgi:hypothetical protein
LRTKNYKEIYTRYLVLCSIVGAAIIIIPMLLQQIVGAQVLKTGENAPDFKLIDSEKGNILTKQNFKGKPYLFSLLQHGAPHVK